MANLEEEIKQEFFASQHIKANINVLFTANWIYNRISAHLKPYNLTHEQFNVLRILRGSHPKSMCQKDVLHRMVAPNSNVTLIVKKLKDKGWIQVEQSERDKREYVINISDSGLDLLKIIDVEMESYKENYMRLTEDEAQQLNLLLDKMRS